MSDPRQPAAVDISVILPTLNRADSLREALERLQGQTTDGRFTYEMIVVDNGSTDHTRRVVEAMQPACPVPLRYVREPRRGRPWALNTGMAAAQGRIFAFTDDDILAPATWLSALWGCFEAEQPDGVAGRVLPLWTSPPPAWLVKDGRPTLGQMGCIDHGTERRSSRDGRYCRWVGGNLAVRREAVERAGPYDVRMVRGQDWEWFWRFMDQGLVVCYEPAAVVQHKVGAERMTPAYFRQWRQRAGFYDALVIPWKPSHVLTVMPLWRTWVTVGVLAVWVWRTVTWRPWIERFKAELLLLEEMSIWVRRLQLWPRWSWGVLTRGDCGNAGAGVWNKRGGPRHER